ncbi:hypothetical protein ACX51_14920 [Lacticaseibacillus paracasei]|uniref:Uncharacterized protein n=1 Tax=Lacticaseibacillus paracasei TaxID=1597 RepID=A0ABD6VWP1_LACPA|nr:hypothetical protein [Lacticaseibacillus paracasei]POE38988.1 hypothetical protein ACX51_14920 [Lacticaseibacillus paracasei]
MIMPGKPLDFSVYPVQQYFATNLRGAITPTEFSRQFSKYSRQTMAYWASRDRSIDDLPFSFIRSLSKVKVDFPKMEDVNQIYDTLLAYDSLRHPTYKGLLRSPGPSLVTGSKGSLNLLVDGKPQLIDCGNKSNDLYVTYQGVGVPDSSRCLSITEVTGKRIIVLSQPFDSSKPDDVPHELYSLSGTFVFAVLKGTDKDSAHVDVFGTKPNIQTTMQYGNDLMDVITSLDSHILGDTFATGKSGYVMANGLRIELSVELRDVKYPEYSTINVKVQKGKQAQRSIGVVTYNDLQAASNEWRRQQDMQD